MLLNLYYLILIACLVASILCYKYHSSLRIFPWMMTMIITVEIMAYLLSHILVINPFPLYHFFLPAWGLMLSYFFYQNIPDKIARNVLAIATFICAITSLGFSFFVYKLTDFPGLSLNLLGILMILASLYLLLTLEPIFNIPIYKHPLAWICIGMIVFYTGTFFLNGAYNYLVKTNNESRALIHSIINNGLNIFMYSCFTIGLICSHKLKKFTEPAPGTYYK